MKEIAGKTRQFFNNKKLGFYLVVFAVCLMAFIALIRFGTLFFWLPIWSWVTSAITNSTGADVWLAKALAALLIIPMVYIFPLVFSWKRNKRKTGIVLLCVCTVVICMSMFFITQDAYFSFKSGEPIKWYIITPQGEYKFSSLPGFDPVWGKKYEPVTPKVVEEYMTKIGRGEEREILLEGKENEDRKDVNDIKLIYENLLTISGSWLLLETVPQEGYDFQFFLPDSTVRLEWMYKNFPETKEILNNLNGISSMVTHGDNPRNIKAQVRVVSGETIVVRHCVYF